MKSNEKKYISHLNDKIVNAVESKDSEDLQIDQYV